MILLDTHIWVRWIHGDKNLSENIKQIIKDNEINGLGISIISCWEVAKLVEYKRLILPLDIKDWFSIAINYPGIKIFPLTPDIIIESTQLPGEFHKDPADQLITATSRLNKIPILTLDEKIIKYKNVNTLKF